MMHVFTKKQMLWAKNLTLFSQYSYDVTLEDSNKLADIIYGGDVRPGRRYNEGDRIVLNRVREKYLNARNYDNTEDGDVWLCLKTLDMHDGSKGFTYGEQYNVIGILSNGLKFINDRGIEHSVLNGNDNWVSNFVKINISGKVR